MQREVPESPKTVGKLVAADYDRIVPEVEALVKQEGNIRMLMDLDEFHGRL
ncbi:MAG: STAS/SEC14 domain-containing protein [Euryarchaeota archaeon]|nr:STAS/SEC14 domain-containing protein [Euryarchaeota archaeon]